MVTFDKIWSITNKCTSLSCLHQFSELYSRYYCFKTTVPWSYTGHLTKLYQPWQLVTISGHIWSQTACTYLAELPGDEREAVGALLEVGGELGAGGVVLGALAQQRRRRRGGTQRGGHYNKGKLLLNILY